MLFSEVPASLDGLPEGGLAAVAAHLTDARDVRTLRATCRALRGAGAGGVAAVRTRFPGAAAIELVGPRAASSTWVVQAAAMRLLKALHAWGAAAAATAASPAASATAPDAAPPPPLAWPGVARVVGCPSTCVQALAALCPGITSLDVTCADALSLLDGAVRPLTALTGLTALSFAAPRGDDGARGVLWCTAAIWDALGSLTRLQRLAVDCRRKTTHWHCPPLPALTALTELTAPLSYRQCDSMSALTGLRRLGLLDDEEMSMFLCHVPRLPGVTSVECEASHCGGLPMLFLSAPGAPSAALARLLLPNINIGQPALEALAVGCPNLTALKLHQVSASQGCAAAFPRLQELACAFHVEFRHALPTLAPALERLELAAGPAGVRPRLLVGASRLTQLVLTAPLASYSETDAGLAFCAFLPESVSSLELRAWMAYDESGDNDVDALRDFLGAGTPRYLTRLALSCDRPDVYLATAYAFLHANNVEELSVTSRHFYPDALVSAACLFMNLRELTIVQSEGADPEHDFYGGWFADEHLSRLEAQLFLERVTLGGCHGVTQDGVDALTRRAEARGRPLRVVQLSLADCQRLAGVSIGGWIIVSLLCGAALGVLATLLFQCGARRRQRRARFAAGRDEEGAAAAAGGGARKGPRSSSPPLPPLLPAREPVPRPVRSAPIGLGPLTASVQAPGKSTPGSAVRPAGRVSAAAGAGGGASQLDAQLTAADTRVADQIPAKQAARGSHVDAIRQFVTTEYVEQVGSPLSSPGVQDGQAAPAGARPAADQQQPGAAVAAVQQQQRQQRQLQHPQHQRGGALSAQPSALSAAGAGAAPAHEVDDSYELEELDSDWKALLGDVDSRLAAVGAAPMDARERAVAIKKLLVATSTRGVDFAMDATIEEVIRFRSFHAGRGA
ncbi:MAG: hypothetical protein J3K34DRAFT_521336 [Monoraphidium minutum]|nr:MAG: hypothetical protein J3K34DRAFT_521336 [Monoraphidium minutum]